MNKKAAIIAGVAIIGLVGAFALTGKKEAPATEVAGDEVITTPYTYTATSSAAIHRGVKPIYVDVKKDTFMLDIDKVAAKITDRTRAIIPVDIAGVPFELTFQ